LAFLLLAVDAGAEDITFTFSPPASAEIESVTLRGSFNGWGETPMTPQPDGSWSVTTPLDPGKYQYKFYINGEWPADMRSGPNEGRPIDPDADAYAPDGYDGVNAVRFVGSTEKPELGEELTAEMSDRFTKMKESAGTMSITIYPIIMLGQPHRNVAEVAAVLLERANVEEIDVSDDEFNTSAVSSVWETAGSFSTYVRGVEFATDYAMLGEYLGGPDTGPAGIEVRSIIVDREGNLVWVDSQKPGDPDFDVIKPDSPMMCTYFMINRLRTQLGLPDPERKSAPEGRWSAYLNEASARPADEEFAAMEERLSTMRDGFASSALVVFPVLVNSTINTEHAQLLVKALNEGQTCKAKVAPDGLVLEVEPGPNEAKMLWNLARSFRRYVGNNAIDGEYALYAQYIVESESGEAHAVHFVVCDAEGCWVVVDLQNSHQLDFQALAPLTEEKCNGLVITRLGRYLEE
jgi:hypothetical protein